MQAASAHKTRRTYNVSTPRTAPLATQLAPSTLTWTHVPLVPQVALVGHQGDLPVAVIDQIGSAGFRASLCNGTNVGVFSTLDECKRAVTTALAQSRSSSRS